MSGSLPKTPTTFIVLIPTHSDVLLIMANESMNWLRMPDYGDYSVC